MKKWLLLTFIISLVILYGCKESIEEEEVTKDPCIETFDMFLNEVIPFKSIHIPYSEVTGNPTNFIRTCKLDGESPITLKNASIQSHYIVLNFDAIYPIGDLLIEQLSSEKMISSISIEVSLNGNQYKRIMHQASLEDYTTTFNLGGTMAKSIRLIFQSDNQQYGFKKIEARLNDGIIIKEALDYTKEFLRYEGWTGGDGIFTFNLTSGDEKIGALKNTVGYIFSDTFIGEVYPHNNLRKSSVMINNSFGYQDMHKPLDEAFDFVWGNMEGTPDSLYHPESYIGKKPRNLLDGDGLSISQSPNATLTNLSEGFSFISNDHEDTLIIDLKDVYTLNEIYLWNLNEEPEKGTKDFDLFLSSDGENYTLFDSYTLDQASGSNEEPYTLKIDLENEARFIKLHLKTSYDDEKIGLGKIMIFGENDQFLFGEISSISYDQSNHPNEASARLWLQDGVVINDHLYLFPILVKDEGDLFKVHNVGLIKTPILNERLNLDQTTYLNTPLQVKTEDGGTIFFGAGLMNHVEIDGYIYIYGYKDLNGRHLVVGRFKPEDIENMNAWTYFNGTSFIHDINQVVGLKNQVSAELSVTYIEEGIFAGKYMLVVMENTTSGKISYSLSDTPYGPFGDYQLVYQTIENTYLRGGFTYNAKLHPALSKPGEFLISYNVNTTLAGALSDANIYYPRFIKMIEVKK